MAGKNVCEKKTSNIANGEDKLFLDEYPTNIKLKSIRSKYGGENVSSSSSPTLTLTQLRVIR